MTVTINTILLFAAAVAWACTGVFHADGNRVIAGNNEDFLDPATYVWAFPPQAGCYGRVYFGYAFSPVQGGVNDKGLYFDGFALPARSVSDSRPPFAGDLIQKAMETCSLVTEVADLFSPHNLRWLSSSQLMFGDRHGNSMIVECDTVLFKQGAYQVATNFSQSATPPDSITCWRYLAADRILARSGSPGIDLMRSVLDSTHAAGADVNTLYSNIYDLTNGLIYLYFFHDYGSPLVLDIAAEIAGGPSARSIRSLFPSNAAADAHKARMDSILISRLAARPMGALDTAAWTGNSGEYVIDQGFQRIGETITVTCERSMLKIVFSHLRKFGAASWFFPDTAADRFFSISHLGESLIRFERDTAGAVTGLLAGNSIHAKKNDSIGIERTRATDRQSGIRFSVSPNPVNRDARFRVDGPAMSGSARITIYDVRGRMVRALTCSAAPADLVWRPGRVVPGLYTAVLVADGFRHTLRFLILE